MIDQNLVETIRTMYQLEMKKSVVVLSKILDVNYGGVDVVEEIDKQLKLFVEAKERATHFESIVKTLSSQNEKEKLSKND